MSTIANIPPSGPAGPRHVAPEDLVLYAMQLLNASESQPIVQHLRTCPECSAELARVYSDLALTAATVEIETPPESARQRLLQQVAREKKIVSKSAAPPQPQAAGAPTPVPSFGRSASILSIDDAAESHPKRSVGRTILGVAGWAIAAGLAVAAGLQYKDRQNLRDTLRAKPHWSGDSPPMPITLTS